MTSPILLRSYECALNGLPLRVVRAGRLEERVGRSEGKDARGIHPVLDQHAPGPPIGPQRRPITPAVNPLPIEAKRALRPTRSPNAACPTDARLIAAIPGLISELAKP